MSVFATHTSDRIGAMLEIGKYTRWARDTTLTQWCRLVSAVTAFDEAVFPTDCVRTVFPVFDLDEADGNPFRVQIPLEALCVLREAAVGSVGPTEVLASLNRLSTPLAPLEDADPLEPAFREEARRLLESDPSTAGWAGIDEATGWAMLWSLGEVRARTHRFDSRLVFPRIVSAKRHREPLEPRAVRRTAEYSTPVAAGDFQEFSSDHCFAVHAALDRLLCALHADPV